MPKLHRLVVIVELQALFWSANLSYRHLCPVDQVVVYAGMLATTYNYCYYVRLSTHPCMGYLVLVFPLEAVHVRGRTGPGHYQLPGWRQRTGQTQPVP
jgi:hypothetical protein